MRRLASAAALVLALFVAAPADAQHYGRPAWGFTPAPGWSHAPPPPRHWYRPHHPPPHWDHPYRPQRHWDRPHRPPSYSSGWRSDHPRRHWRERRYGWGPRDRW